MAEDDDMNDTAQSLREMRHQLVQTGSEFRKLYNTIRSIRNAPVHDNTILNHDLNSTQQSAFQHTYPEYRSQLNTQGFKRSLYSLRHAMSAAAQAIRAGSLNTASSTPKGRDAARSLANTLHQYEQFAINNTHQIMKYSTPQNMAQLRSRYQQYENGLHQVDPEVERRMQRDDENRLHQRIAQENRRYQYAFGQGSHGEGGNLANRGYQIFQSNAQRLGSTPDVQSYLANNAYYEEQLNRRDQINRYNRVHRNDPNFHPINAPEPHLARNYHEREQAMRQFTQAPSRILNGLYNARDSLNYLGVDIGASRTNSISTHRLSEIGNKIERMVGTIRPTRDKNGNLTYTETPQYRITHDDEGNPRTVVTEGTLTDRRDRAINHVNALSSSLSHARHIRNQAYLGLSRRYGYNRQNPNYTQQDFGQNSFQNSAERAVFQRAAQYQKEDSGQQGNDREGQLAEQYRESTMEYQKLHDTQEKYREGIDTVNNSINRQVHDYEDLYNNRTYSAADAAIHPHKTYVSAPAYTMRGMLQRMGGGYGMSIDALYAGLGRVHSTNLSGNNIRQQIEPDINAETMGYAINRGTNNPSRHNDNQVMDRLAQNGIPLGENTQQMAQFLGAAMADRNLNPNTQNSVATNIAGFSRYNNVSNQTTSQLYSEIGMGGGLGNNPRGNSLDYSRQFAGMLHNDHLGGISNQQAQGLSTILGGMVGSGQTLSPTNVRSIMGLQSQLSSGRGGQVFQGQQGAQQLQNFSQGVASQQGNMLVRNAFAGNDPRYGGQQGLYQLQMDMQEPLKHPGHLNEMIQNLSQSGLGPAGTELQLTRMGLSPDAARKIYSESVSGRLTPQALHRVTSRDRRSGRSTERHARKEYHAQGNSTLDIHVAVDQEGNIRSSQAFDRTRHAGNILSRFMNNTTTGSLLRHMGGGILGMFNHPGLLGSGLLAAFANRGKIGGAIRGLGRGATVLIDAGAHRLGQLGPLRWGRQKISNGLSRLARIPKVRRFLNGRLGRKLRTAMGSGAKSSGGGLFNHSINASNNTFKTNYFYDNHFIGGSGNGGAQPDNSVDNGGGNNTSNNNTDENNSTESDSDKQRDENEDNTHEVDNSGESEEDRIGDRADEAERNGDYEKAAKLRHAQRDAHLGKDTSVLRDVENAARHNPIRERGPFGRFFNDHLGSLGDFLARHTGWADKLASHFPFGRTKGTGAMADILRNPYVRTLNGEDTRFLPTNLQMFAQHTNTARDITNAADMGANATRATSVASHTGGLLSHLGVLGGVASKAGRILSGKTLPIAGGLFGGLNGLTRLRNANSHNWFPKVLGVAGGAAGGFFGMPKTGQDLASWVGSQVTHFGHPKSLHNELRQIHGYSSPIARGVAKASVAFQHPVIAAHHAGRDISRGWNATKRFGRRAGHRIGYDFTHPGQALLGGLRHIGNGAYNLKKWGGEALGKGGKLLGGLLGHAGLGNTILGRNGIRALAENYAYLRVINMLLPRIATKLSYAFSADPSLTGNRTNASANSKLSSGNQNISSKALNGNVNKGNTTNNNNTNNSTTDSHDTNNYYLSPAQASKYRNSANRSATGQMGFFSQHVGHE